MNIRKDTAESGFPDNNGDKKELKGTRIVTSRLTIGEYRVFYQIDEEEKEV
ncbi:type II toxin-antitoxin system RelE family toxin [Methanosarcina lacustris]|uniref:type II toxin-antitoxin system RelE family toxin n=1 Tax=Methanosarcina lacustris TaxID=170861 RepID=UPI000AA87DC7|nr:hypothetical protein [Methanosarcina lacustris]